MAVVVHQQQSGTTTGPDRSVEITTADSWEINAMGHLDLKKGDELVATFSSGQWAWIIKKPENNRSGLDDYKRAGVVAQLLDVVGRSGAALTTSSSPHD